MRPDLLGDVVRRGLPQPPHPDGLVGTAGVDGRPVGGEARVQGGGGVLVLDLRLGEGPDLAALLLDLPAAEAGIPVGADEEVGVGRPRQRRDAVVSGLGDVAVIGGDGCSPSRGGGRDGPEGRHGDVTFERLG